MAPRALITAVLLCLVLVQVTPAAQGVRIRRSCCTGYVKRPVHFQSVTGYREQSPLENCCLEAIIFYTTKKEKICASPKDDWVKKLLKMLSSKLNKMSKAPSAVTKSHAADGGRGLGSTEPLPSSTAGFY